MAKNMQETERVSGDDNGEQVEKPVSIRDTIRQAMKEQNEAGETEVDNESEQEERVEVKSKAKAKEAEADEKEETEEQTEQEETSEEEKEETSEEGEEVSSKQESKLKAPPGWTKEAKAQWDKLSPDVQKSVAKRESEFSKGIAKYAEKAKAYDELETVIGPRRQAIQQFGTTPVQTVDRLFQWMEALAGPQKIAAFKQLASNFGIDINEVTGAPARQDNRQEETATTTDEDGNPILKRIEPVLNQFTQTVDQRLKSTEEVIAEMKRASTEQYIMNWAKDKPYFNNVRAVMGQLIQSGIVPLKNGEIDLDGAYEKAISLSPEIASQVQAEKQKKENEAKEIARAKKIADNAKKVAHAKKASVSLTSNAPFDENASNSPKNKNNKPVSARDSIRNAINELAGNT